MSSKLHNSNFKNKNIMKNSRRDFVKKLGVGTAGLAIGGTAMGFSAKSYSQIIGANDRIRVAVAGVHSRGLAHIEAISKCPNVSLEYVCDVDSKVAEIAVNKAVENTGVKPRIEMDVRKLVEKKDVDLVTIATPEHWHAPLTIMAVKAGKHVYVEKPVAHNLHEGELLTKLANKYPDTIIQMGVQGRSGGNNIIGIKEMQDGIIGDVYLAKAWYSNIRGTIGVGKKAPVPEWLDWDLWQGPASRQDYKDNIVHYNWHWFKNWGTGEMGNNAIHQLDACLWGLNFGYPEKITSFGGRYHFRDDWEFCDTQVSTYEYKDGKQIIWEGRSCNPYMNHEAPNGTIFFGTKGTVKILPEDDNYVATDLSGKVIRELGKHESHQPDLTGWSTMDLTISHFTNLMDAIRGKVKASAPIQVGVKANALCLLGNISQEVGRTLKIDQKKGKIIGDKEAAKMAYREYEKGWEPKV